MTVKHYETAEISRLEGCFFSARKWTYRHYTRCWKLSLVVNGRGNRADQQKIIAEYAHLAEGAGQKCLTYEKEVDDSVSSVLVR